MKSNGWLDDGIPSALHTSLAARTTRCQRRDPSSVTRESLGSQNDSSTFSSEKRQRAVWIFFRRRSRSTGNVKHRGCFPQRVLRNICKAWPQQKLWETLSTLRNSAVRILLDNRGENSKRRTAFHGLSWSKKAFISKHWFFLHGSKFRNVTPKSIEAPYWANLGRPMLLMEEILHQLVGSLSQYLQGSLHPRWCRISSINSMSADNFSQYFGKYVSQTFIFGSISQPWIYQWLKIFRRFWKLVGGNAKWNPHVVSHTLTYIYLEPKWPLFWLKRALFCWVELQK